MTTGSLDYPFARTSTRPRWRPRQPWRASCDLDMSGARQIGELAVDRESMERVLSDSPQSLQTILDALMDALRQETRPLSPPPHPPPHHPPPPTPPPASHPL